MGLGFKDAHVRLTTGSEFMKTVEVTKATQPLADYTRKVKKGPVIITHEGKPVAALISISNADIETVSLGSNPKFLALIERSRARRKTEGGISTEEMRRRLEKPKRSKIM
jgi:prevent-host-death family protein